MITPTFLAQAYDRNVQIIKRQTDGLTQLDSLIQLPFRANCLNWVVGHVVTNRLSVLRLLSATKLPFDAALLSAYQRESEPILEDRAGVLLLSQLMEMLEQTQSLIAECLAKITNEELEFQIAFLGSRSMSVAEWLMFFYFHDSYHTGQTEILRQAAGKDDKVI